MDICCFIFGKKKTDTKRADGYGRKKVHAKDAVPLFAVPLTLSKRRTEKEIIEAMRAGQVAEMSA